MIIGTIAALCHGVIMPLMVLVFGQVIDSFITPAVSFQHALIISENIEITDCKYL